MSESKKLWGGRFEGKIDPGFAEFNNSYRFDRRLFEADVTASIAYCQALENASVIVEEGTQIRDALNTILKSRATKFIPLKTCAFIRRSTTDRRLATSVASCTPGAAATIRSLPTFDSGCAARLKLGNHSRHTNLASRFRRS